MGKLYLSNESVDPTPAPAGQSVVYQKGDGYLYYEDSSGVVRRLAFVGGSAIIYLTGVAGTNTITGTADGGLNAYAAGQVVVFDPANTNTGAATLNISGLGAKNIFVSGAALTGSEMRANQPVILEYDGTQFNLLGSSAAAGVNMDLLCQGRLTLATGAPVTTADQTAKTSVFFTPYKGDRVALFDGSSTWTPCQLTEQTLAVPATTSQMYDVFAFNNAGNVNIEALAWTSDTARATALVVQNGILCKSGDTTRRYVGSFRTTGTSGQTEDSFAKRYVWNYYNRIVRPMVAVDTTDSWTYSTAAYRQANGNTANQLDFIIGVSEDIVQASEQSYAANSTATIRNAHSGICLDNTNANNATIHNAIAITNTIATVGNAFYKGFPGIGRHFLAWVESGAGADTQTWFGDNTGVLQCGIIGEILG